MVKLEDLLERLDKLHCLVLLVVYGRRVLKETFYAPLRMMRGEKGNRTDL